MPSDKDAKEEEKVPIGRRALSALLAQTSVNPAPVEYWGNRSDPTGAILAVIFPGSTRYSTEGGRVKSRCVCDAAAAVEADPDRFSAVADDDGFTCVHACALNGYLDTLQTLIEEGGAAPFTTTRGRVDALMIARRRGHIAVLEYLSSFEGEGGAEALQSITRRVAERRRREEERRRALTADDDEEEEEDMGAMAARALAAAEAAREMKAAKAAEAKAVAIEAGRKAMLKLAPKTVELLPRRAWRGEVVQMDEKRGIGYYPRKPLQEES